MDPFSGVFETAKWYMLLTQHQQLFGCGVHFSGVFETAKWGMLLTQHHQLFECGVD